MNASQTETTPRRHILTVAIEDYFQVGAFNQRIQRGQWYRFENRIESNTRRALELLKEHDITATFFVLGWIADQMPELVRSVQDAGHEIASRGYYHRSIRQMTREEFREDVQQAGEALERATGVAVRGYRVAHEWFTAADLWALDVLAEEGYVYDSSIGLLFRRFANEPWRRFVHRHQHKGREIVEIPLSSAELAGWSVPIAGGNYFRQIPHTLMKRAVAHWDAHHESPFVMYFHIWELDRQQPHLNAPFLTRIRHYRNLGKLDWILPEYFGKYRFGSIQEHLELPPLVPAERAAPASVVASAADEHESTPVESADLGVAVGEGKPLTIVIPCFNEEMVLPYLANTLASVETKLQPEFRVELLFVDDCSTDDTAASLRRIFGDRPNCRILRHSENRGVAAAIMTGIRAAQSETICSIDCDCTYDPHQLLSLIPMLEDGVDLVTGSPYHELGRVENVPGWRLFLSKGLSMLYGWTLDQKLATYTSCFRVYRRSAFEGLQLKEDGFLGVAEMVALLDLRGSQIRECPAVLEVRVLGLSKMKTLRTIFGHLRLLARVWRLKWQRRADRSAPR